MIIRLYELRFPQQRNHSGLCQRRWPLKESWPQESGLQESWLQESGPQESWLQESGPQELWPQESGPQELWPQESWPLEQWPQELWSYQKEAGRLLVAHLKVRKHMRERERE